MLKLTFTSQSKVTATQVICITDAKKFLLTWLQHSILFSSHTHTHTYTQPFYGYYTSQAVLASTSSENWRTLFDQSFTVHTSRCPCWWQLAHSN